MPDHEIELLGIDRGTVTAPAGCGKTHLIAEALTGHSGHKPILVLTHTNAGIAALRRRLGQIGVPASVYRLYTIDGWAMRLISMFPTRSAHDPGILNLASPSTDYPNIRATAARLLYSGHVSDAVAASYARIVVDEYQDCSVRQHALVACAAEVLPTCVLGDPLQSIFGFGVDALANWDDHVCSHFALVGELNIPWRWINSGEEALGHWLLYVRGQLLRGEPLDLLSAPSSVTWVELDGSEDHLRRLRAARVRPSNGNGHVLIIADSTSPSSQQQVASQTPGAVTVEAVDLKDMVNFARTFSPTAGDALQGIASFAQKVMRNVGAANLLRRVESLARGTARKPPTDVENTALSFLSSPTHRAAADLLVEISKAPGITSHRPTVLGACIKALNLCDRTAGPNFLEAAIGMREQIRLMGRPLPKRAVGSTLLLKGLEADVAVILNADILDARNLYVALTRGSRALLVCSRSSSLDAG